jgi:4,5-dihydroxyphthalate decarboxylase
MSTAPPPSIVVNGADHDHVRSLSGTYHGIALAYSPVSLQVLFPTMLASRSYEVCEFSLANYLILRGTGQHWLSALPVFPSRVFRHSMMVTRRDSDLRDVSALAGKRIGVPDYSMTAAVWVRGLMRAEYGVDHRTICWVTPRKQRFAIPPGARVEHDDSDLTALLAACKIDALLGTAARDDSLRTVLPDAEAAERDYFARTTIFPIMHCVVIRNDVLEKNPGLPAAVAAAYSKAKQLAYERRSGSVLPWGTAAWDRDMAVFGGDPLPYGLNEVNRKVIAQLAADLQEQTFIGELPALDRLFLDISTPIRA